MNGIASRPLSETTRAAAAVRRHLMRFRAIEIFGDFLFAGLKLFSCWGLLSLIWCALDNGIHLENEWRFIAFALGLLPAVLFLGALRGNLRKTRFEENLALRLERYSGHHENWLVNALDFASSSRPVGSVGGAVIREVGSNLGKFPLYKRFGFKKNRNIYLSSFLVALVMLSYLAIWPRYYINGMSRLLVPWQRILPLTRFQPDGPFLDVQVLSGQDHVLDFSLKKGRTRHARLLIRRPDTPGLQEEILTRDSRQRFRYRFEGLRRSLFFRIVVGDFRSLERRIEVVQPPRILKSKLAVAPPGYLGLPPRLVEDVPENNSIPRNSSVTLELTLEPAPDSLEAFHAFTGESIPFTRLSSGRFRMEHRLEKTRLLGLRYRLGTFAPANLPVKYHFNALKDLPPEVRCIGEASRRIPPDEKYFEFAVRGKDDYGIKSARLLYRKKGETEWQTLETLSLDGSPRVERKWFLDFTRFECRPRERIELAVSMNDGYPENAHERFSRAITVGKMGNTAFNLSVLEELIAAKHALRRWMIRALLEPGGVTPVRASRTLETILSKLDSCFVKIKNAGLSDIRIFMAQRKMADLRETLGESENFKTAGDAFNGILSRTLEIWNDLEAEKSRLVNRIVQDAFVSLKERLDELSESLLDPGFTPSLFDTGEGLFLKSIFSEQSRKLERDGEPDLARFFTRITDLMGSRELTVSLETLARFVDDGALERAARRAETLAEKVDGLIGSLFVSRREERTPDTAEIAARVRRIIDALSRLQAMLSRMDLQSDPPLRELERAADWIGKTLESCSGRVAFLQRRFPSVGLKGITLLNAAVYNLDELRTRYRNQETLKAESKLKKVVNSISGAVFLLEKFIDSADTASPKEPRDATTERAPVMKLIKPVQNLVVTPRSTVAVSGIASADDGISQVWLDLVIRDRFGNVRSRESVLAREFLNFPVEARVEIPLSIQNLNVDVPSRIEITLRCLEYGENASPATGQSRSCWLKVREAVTRMDLPTYFHFKALVSGILDRLLAAEREILEDIRSMERAYLAENEGNVPAGALREIINRQSLVKQKYSECLERLEVFANSGGEFPEPGFLFHASFARDLPVRDFAPLENALLQLSTLARENASRVPALLPLVFETRSRLETLIEKLGTLKTFFGQTLRQMVNRSRKAGLIQQARDILSREFAGLRPLFSRSGASLSELAPRVRASLDRIAAKLEKIEGLQIPALRRALHDFEKLLASGNIENVDSLKRCTDLFFRENELELEHRQKNALREKLKTTVDAIRRGDGRLDPHLETAKNLVEGLAALGEDTFLERIALERASASARGPDAEGLSEKAVRKMVRVLGPLDESPLDAWSRISLMDHKLSLLAPEFDAFAALDRFDNADERSFKRLSAIFHIFLHQIRSLKDVLGETPDPEERRKQLEKLESIASRADLLRKKISKIDETLEKSAWRFMKDFESKADEALEEKLAGNKRDRPLSRRVESMNTILEKLPPVFETVLADPPQKRASLEKAIETAADSIAEIVSLSGLEYGKVFRSREDAPLLLLKDLILLTFALNREHDAAVSRLKARIATGYLDFKSSFANVLNRLADDLYRENRKRYLEDIDETIKQTSLELRRVRESLLKLTKVVDKSLEDHEQIESLQQKVLELENRIETLERRKRTIANRDKIRVAPMPDDSMPLPETVRLGFESVSDQIEQADRVVTNENARLDELILRNLAEEIEEIQASRLSGDAGEREKVFEIRKKLSLIHRDAVLPPGGLPGPGDLERVETEIRKKKQSFSMGRVIESLQKAAESADPAVSENEPRKQEASREKRYRYLNLFQKRRERFQRVQDRMGEARILSSRFKTITDEMLEKLGEQVEELRQHIDRPVEWDEIRMRVEDTLKNVTMAFSRESRILFSERDPFQRTLKEGSRELDTELQARIPGFEELIREYLIQIASE
jgi:hypothetical protein